MGANDALIHSQSGFKPKIFPVINDVAPVEIDRAQSLDPKGASQREKVEELGRTDVVGYVSQDPSITTSLSQREYGSFELFRKLACKSDATTDIVLDDFGNSYFDIAAYLQDIDGNFEGTLWYPEQRLSGFGISISSPTALIDRSFDMIGEKAKILQGNNKYLIYLRKEVESGEAGTVSIVIGSGDYANYPAPVVNPDVASEYILRVIKVRGTVNTELVVGTDCTWTNGTLTLSVPSCLVGDVIKVYYTASTYITGSDYWTANNTDMVGMLPHSCSLYIGTSNYLYKIQSADIKVSLDREDQKEIGNKNVVLRSVKNKTVTITLGRILDKWTIEEVLRGEAVGYGVIDVSMFATNLTFIAAFYDDSTKTTFKWGFKCTNLAPSSFTLGSGSIDNIVKSDTTLEGENMTLTTLEATLGL